MATIIEHKHVDRAEELVHLLSPFHDFWRNTGGMNQWLFRGQRDSAWQLVPAAARPNAFRFTKKTGGDFSVSIYSLQSQLDAEEGAVLEFKMCIRDSV